MKQIGFLALIILFAFNSRADDNHLGFFQPDDSQIPAAVKAASNSVVQIALPAGDISTVGQVFQFLNPTNINQVVNFVKSAPLPPPLNSADRDVILFQLNNCVKQSNPMNCAIYSLVSHGSGFLMSDGSRIRTAFHVISNWVSNNASSNKNASDLLDVSNLPIFVYFQNRLLYSPPQTGTAIFLSSNLDHMLNYDWEDSNDDLVEIQLTKKIGPGLTAKGTPLKAGDQVFIIGYPGTTTTDRTQFGATNAIANTLSITHGIVVSKAAEIKNWGGADWSTFPAKYQKMFESESISTDADGLPGMSGGLAVDAQGRFVGTFTGSAPADGSAALLHESEISNEATFSLK